MISKFVCETSSDIRYALKCFNAPAKKKKISCMFVRSIQHTNIVMTPSYGL